MAKRAEKLVYLAEDKPGKHPTTSYIPPAGRGDVSGEEVARMSDEQYARVTAAHPTLGPLYAPSKGAAAEVKPAPPPAVVPDGEAVADAEPVAGPAGGAEGRLGRG